MRPASAAEPRSGNRRGSDGEGYEWTRSGQPWEGPSLPCGRQARQRLPAAAVTRVRRLGLFRHLSPFVPAQAGAPAFREIIVRGLGAPASAGANGENARATIFNCQTAMRGGARTLIGRGVARLFSLSPTRGVWRA